MAFLLYEDSTIHNASDQFVSCVYFFFADFAFHPTTQTKNQICTRQLQTAVSFKFFVPCIFLVYEMKNQQMSLFQFYSYIDGSLHVSGPQAHLQEISHSCSHNQELPGTNGCVNSCVNPPEGGPVGPKHVEIRRYINKIEIVKSVGFSFHILTTRNQWLCEQLCELS